MANNVTKVFREAMIEDNVVDVPFNSKGFINWLCDIKGITTNNANHQIQLIREMDALIYEPGEIDTFQSLAGFNKEVDEAKSEIVRVTNIDFIFIMLISEIEYLQDLKDTVLKKYHQLLNETIEAYKLYLEFMSHSLNYSAQMITELQKDIFDDHVFCPVQIEDESVHIHQKYDSILLENEFIKYLKDSKYTQRTRHKMLTNIRKLNNLIINNGRGDSDWMRKLVEDANTGINVRSRRFTINTLVNRVIQNLDDTCGISESELRGGLSAFNQYINFLIHTYGSKQHNSIRKV